MTGCFTTECMRETAKNNAKLIENITYLVATPTCSTSFSATGQPTVSEGILWLCRYLAVAAVAHSCNIYQLDIDENINWIWNQSKINWTYQERKNRANLINKYVKSNRDQQLLRVMYTQ